MRSATTSTLAQPVLRWTGGKRWLASLIAEATADIDSVAYVEPFLGGAAVFLSRPWPSALLGDANAVLIAAYRGLRSDPAKVAKRLTTLPVDRQTYDRVRRMTPRSDVGHSVRLLYLNRTAFGGIYRVNAHGDFTTPFAGDRTASRPDDFERFRTFGEALVGAALVGGDFETTLRTTKPGSIVYCDPVYALPHAASPYGRYTYPPFTWADQQRLAAAINRVVGAGSLVLLSNAIDDSVLQLYPTAAVLELSRRSMYQSQSRVRVTEGLYVLGPTNMVEMVAAAIDAQRAVRSSCGGWV